MGSNEFLITLLERPLVYAWSLVVALIISTLLAHCTRVSLLGGLLAYYGYLIVNLASALFLWWCEAIDSFRFTHFLISELILYVVICTLYKSTAPTLVKLAQSTDRRTLRRLSALTIGVILLGAVYTGLMITDESSSRVEFQLTSSAFSFIKPFLYIAFAAAAFLLFIQVRRWAFFGMASLTLGSMVLFSVVAQSKGGFIVSLLSAYLLLREYGYISRDAISADSQKRNRAILILTVIAFVGNLYLLQIDPFALLARIIYSSDSVFMTYPFPVPSDLCTGVDWLSAYHRGVGRALQLPASHDPTTIFGVRLVQNVEIEDALRGPNARVSSYSMCNFGTLSTLPFLIYLSLLLVLQKEIVRSIGRRRPQIQLLVLPYFISTLVDSAQDVYKIMTGFTILFAVWLIVNLIPHHRNRNRKRNQNGRPSPIDRYPYEGSAS